MTFGHPRQSAWRSRRPARRRRVVGAALAASASVALLISGCSALGLSSGPPPNVSIVTSAAPVATDATSTGPAVTVPTLGVSTPGKVTVTPWASLTATSAPPTTSAPLTAATTTRTLTFKTFSSVTKPTVAAASVSATPPPPCYSQGSCPAIDSASAGPGSVVVVNPPGADNTVAILTAGGKPADALSLIRLGSPTVSCSGSQCLVQGSKSGVWFGNLVTVSGTRLKPVPGLPTSAGAMRLVGSGSSLLVAGTQQFDGYGLPPSDAPVAARTWALSGGQLASTGCGAPRLYSRPPAATSPQRGTCSGTPQIAGYGSASAHPIAYLGGFATQSGNISCAVLSGSRVECTAQQYDFSVPTCSESTSTVPKGLRGLRVRLGKSGGVSHDDCVGYDLIGSPTTPIGYDRLAAGSGFVCEVQQSGVSCTAPSGRGFTLSRSSVRSN